MAETHAMTQFIKDGQDTSTGDRLFKVKNTYLESNLTDTLVNAIKTVDIVHHEIHEGDHYKVYARTTASSTQNAILVCRTSTGSTKAHIVFYIDARRACEVSLYEGSTNVSGGTTLTAYNNNRNSANTPVAITKWIANPSVGATGTRIDNDQLGSSQTGPQSIPVGGSAAARQEWILKNSAKTTYHLLADSLANNNVITLKGYWYEE